MSTNNVLAHKMYTREILYKQEGRDVALKFVKFLKRNYEDILGREKEDKSGEYGGTNKNGNWVESQYFARLKKFGDFKAATHFEGGNRRPYMDFGISEITKNTITS